jgi:hypothetical protein
MNQAAVGDREVVPSQARVPSDHGGLDALQLDGRLAKGNMQPGLQCCRGESHGLVEIPEGRDPQRVGGLFPKRKLEAALSIRCGGGQATLHLPRNRSRGYGATRERVHHDAGYDLGVERRGPEADHEESGRT